jgi:gluconate 2-dehydrogenase gamma chain
MTAAVHGRREFMKALAVGASASAIGAMAHAEPGTTPKVQPIRPPVSKTNAKPHAWRFFNRDEVRAVEAAIARLIPADELGPGAKEAGVAVFLDMQLAGAWGSGDNLYRQGPFVAGTSQQGYQLSFTPAEMFRMGLAKLEEAAKRSHGGSTFADLAPTQQDMLLAQVEQGQVDFGVLPSGVFFAALLDATMEGFFGDPMYGGNREMIGWKLVGFPGVYASYANDIERHGIAWTRPPESIMDGGGHHDEHMS